MTSPYYIDKRFFVTRQNFLPPPPLANGIYTILVPLALRYVNSILTEQRVQPTCTVALHYTRSKTNAIFIHFLGGG